MKIYSNGKDKVLKGNFPTHFRLLNEGVEVPFIRTSKGSIRLSGDIPFGELDIEEIIRKKVPQPAKLGAESLAIINKAVFDKIDILNKKLTINQEQMNAHLSALTEKEATLANLETQNAQAIDQTNLNMVEMAKAFGKEIQADRDALLATSSGIKQVLSETAEVLDAKLQAHEVAKNPHKITKATVGLDAVDNTSDLDKPVSKATQKALDKKADKKDIEDLDKRLLDADKKQNTLMRNLETVNLYGGVGGNELPDGGKKGQILSKKTKKSGDYEWIDNPVVKIHNDLSGRDASDAHPISSITGLQNALDEKQPTISDLDTIRSDAQAGKDASDTIATYGDIVTHDTDEFATSAQGALADTAVQPDDLANVATTGSYDDLIDKPTIGNATLTIQKNGTNVDTFTANATTNKTIDISVPTDTSDLTNGAGYITKDVNDLTNYTLTSSLGSAAFTSSTDYATSAQGAKADTAVQPSALNNYVTLNTKQTITAPKFIVGEDSVPTGSNQGMVFCGLSTKSANTRTSWIGRSMFGAKDLTFLLGTFSNMAAIGVHKWTNSATGAGAAWDDCYIMPDGTTATYIGGYDWTKNSGWFKVKNTGSGTGGTVQVNRGTIASASWKGVACWGDNISNFTNDSGYITGITSSDVTTALGFTPYNSTNPSGYQANVIETIKVNGTAQTVTSKAVDITVPTNNNQLTNGAGYITGIDSGDVTTALGYTPVNPSSLATVATSGQYSDLTGTPTIPTVNNSTITIQKNGTTVDSFTTNASSNKSINITVPTSASEVSALPSSTKYGADLSYSSNTLQLLDQDGNSLGSPVTISGGGGSSSLATLTDVTLTTPTSGQALLYDGSKWVNGSAGVSATKADVDLNNLNSEGKSKLGPTTYTVNGTLFNSSADNVGGIGSASVFLYKNGLAEIHFSIRITTTGSSSSVFSCGLNRDLLSNLNNNIPTITPKYGSYTYYTTSGSIAQPGNGYGGYISPLGQFWTFGRIYDTSGNVGAWPASNFVSGQYLVGVCYGTYTV